MNVEPARDADVAALAALNNRFAPEGLTLPRSEAWVASHIADYLVVRDENGHVEGCVCLDDYSPSLVELVSLAVLPSHQGRGLGHVLIQAAVSLATRRGYPEIFAVSFSDSLFLHAGFARADVERYPEKRVRYAAVSADEWSIGHKHCFSRDLREAQRPTQRETEGGGPA